MRATIYTKIQTRGKDRGGKDKVPKDPPDYPSNEEVTSWFRKRGWELPSNLKLVEAKKAQSDLESVYVAQAKEISKQFPEEIIKEIENTIFFGYIGDDQVNVMVSRPSVGVVTIRLVYESLPKLCDATQQVASKIWAGEIGNEDLTLIVRAEQIKIFERAHQAEILYGDVITRPFRYALRRSPNERFLMIVAGTAALILFFYLSTNYAPAADTFYGGNLDRLLTAMVTSFVVATASIVVNWSKVRGRDKVSIHWHPPELLNGDR